MKHLRTSSWSKGSSLLLSAALAMCTLGCGAASDSETNEQSSMGAQQGEGSSEGQSPESSNEEVSTSNDELPSTGGLPINQDGGSAAGGSMLSPLSLLEEEQCTSGWLRTEPNPDSTCASTFGGLCFESDQAACECAGCASDQCIVAESFPTQVSCNSLALGCNFLVAGECYPDELQACDAANCGDGQCIFQESYPAVTLCEE